MVLLRGFQIGTMYKLLGNIISDRCNSFIVPNIGAEKGKNLEIYGEKTMLWHQRLGHIRKNGIQVLHDKGMIEGMENFSLDLDLCEYCLYEK
jgi:excinuclease UvrABC helicase subunit UvrB